MTPASMPSVAETHTEVAYLSVITPILNEEKNIPILLDQLFEVLGRIGVPLRLLPSTTGAAMGRSPASVSGRPYTQN